ncbi:MAG TPA: response regulator [Hyphomicrobiales bacterium]|nr:response regulator [Hyphomicrobiales bacterium]
MSEDLSKLHVLLLDDNRNFLSILRSVLRDFGIRDIVEFTSPVAALEYLRNTPVHIALIDLAMPEMNGLEFADRVRRMTDAANPFMPMIMITGHADRSLVQKVINHGIEGLLVKPLRPSALKDRIVALASRPRHYVRTKTGYFGPDRRRRDDPAYSGGERRKDELAEKIRRPGVVNDMPNPKWIPVGTAKRPQDEHDTFIID